MGGREVAPAFGQVLAACLQAAEKGRAEEILEGYGTENQASDTLSFVNTLICLVKKIIKVKA